MAEAIVCSYMLDREIGLSYYRVLINLTTTGKARDQLRNVLRTIGKMTSQYLSVTSQ